VEESWSADFLVLILCVICGPPDSEKCAECHGKYEHRPACVPYHDMFFKCI